MSPLVSPPPSPPLLHRVSGHAYPHRVAPAPQVRSEQRAAGFEPADIDAALADMHESFDIARSDLDLLLARAETHARRRRADLAG